MKIKFAVVDENLFGYIDPRLQLSLQVFRSLITKGGPNVDAGTSYPLPLDSAWVRSDECPKPLDIAKVNAGLQKVKLGANVRPATRHDFETFRISSKGYENDPAYDFPSA